MGTSAPPKPAILTTRWVIAGIVALAAGVILVGALLSDDHSDPAALHERNQENALARAEEEVDRALKAAAAAQESYFLSNERFADNAADLTAEGFRSAPGVLLSKVIAGENSYCMEAQHDRLPGKTFSYWSDKGEVLPEACPF
jgi:hypothetical protein